MEYYPAFLLLSFPFSLQNASKFNHTSGTNAELFYTDKVILRSKQLQKYILMLLAICV